MSETEVIVNVTTGYSAVQIALHWLVAVLILLAWLSGDGAEVALEAVEDGGVAGFVPHIAFGLAILALVVGRILVRLSRGAPAAPGVPGSLPRIAADWCRRLIYLLMIAVPLGGASVFFLGLDVGEVHGLAANILMLGVLGYAVLALYHKYVLKDGLLRRMMKAE